jgi:hypothetical protein
MLDSLTLARAQFCGDFGTITPLVPSDPYMGLTAPLTSRRCILNTYPTNIRTEDFKCAA